MVNIWDSAPPDGGGGDRSGLGPSSFLAGPWRVSPLPPQGSPWRPRWVTGWSPLPNHICLSVHLSTDLAAFTLGLS